MGDFPSKCLEVIPWGIRKPRIFLAEVQTSAADGSQLTCYPSDRSMKCRLQLDCLPVSGRRGFQRRGEEFHRSADLDFRTHAP